MKAFKFAGSFNLLTVGQKPEWWIFRSITKHRQIGLYHPLDGVTYPKYKLFCFLTTEKFFAKEKKALAFYRDRCCHLMLCLRLILFHWRIHQWQWKKFCHIDTPRSSGRLWRRRQKKRSNKNPVISGFSLVLSISGFWWLDIRFLVTGYPVSCYLIFRFLVFWGPYSRNFIFF